MSSRLPTRTNTSRAQIDARAGLYWLCWLLVGAAMMRLMSRLMSRLLSQISS